MGVAALPDRRACFEQKAFSRLGSEPGEKRRRTIRKGLARRYHRPHPALPATTCPPDTVAKRQQRGSDPPFLEALRHNSNRKPCNPCGCEIGVQKGSNPGSTAPPAVECAVRTKENRPTLHFSSRFPAGTSQGWWSASHAMGRKNMVRTAHSTARTIHPADF